MKKMLSTLALSAFIAVGFTGCGGDAPATKKDDKKAATPTAPTGGKDAPKEAAKEAPKK
jgi:ABC-type glycerol-3-phosphate transport system substrate-binding protein